MKGNENVDYYYCNHCDSEINIDEVLYNGFTDSDVCPLCDSEDLDYYNPEECK